MKQKIQFMVIFLTVFLLIGIQPVSGYTLEQTWGPITTSTSNDYYYNFLYATNVLNASGQTNSYAPVSKVTYSGKCDKLNLTLPNSGSCGPYNQVWNGQATIANVSFSWNNNYVWGYFNSTCNYEWTINWNQAEIAEHITYPQSYLFEQTGYCEGWDNDQNLWRHTGTTATTGIPSVTLMTVSHNNPVRLLNGTTAIYSGSSIVAPEASFSCTPTSQTPGSNVVCTDSSTNTPTEWLWMEGITGLSESGWRTSTSQNFTFSETYPATYTVKLKATNSAGSSWLNRTNYVTFDDIYSGTVRTWAYTSDCISGARIYDSDISFYNVDNSTWSNSTQDDDGKFWIDTLPDTVLNIYGDYTKTAGVYSNDSYIGEIVESGATYALQLCPTQQNPGTGNTNVLVTVYDNTNYLPLQYTTVSLKLTSTGATTIDSTGSSGTASFVTTNNSVVTITASKSGYITGSKTLTTSSSTLTTAKIYLDKQIVTTAPTLTAVPGGTIPTTIDPSGGPDSSGNYPSGYSNMKGQQMLDWLAANGMMLVQLCFMVTVLALFGVKFGK